MRIQALALTLALAAAAPAFAQSSSTTVIERERPATGVIIEERSPTVIEKRTTTTETTGTVVDRPAGCDQTTVRKEGVLGSSTEVTKKSC